MRILFSLVLLGGIWLFASPFVLHYLGVARGNAIILGLVLAVIGIMGIAGISGASRA
ncbi:SPW repeat protein [Candidatus Uhrbacteria bacterium]|nr:SPW repeat protein [Candidatus Uhrbacteria bacterium]